MDSAKNILDEIDELCQEPNERFNAFTTFLRQPRGVSFSEERKSLKYTIIERVCTYLVPSLLGIFRGIARGRDNKVSINKSLYSIVSQLYSLSLETISSFGHNFKMETDFASSVFPSFQAIIPHSLNYLLFLTTNDFGKLQSTGIIFIYQISCN